MNTHPETGIPYGVIALNSVNSDVAADLWCKGTNVSEKEAIKEFSDDIRNELEALNEGLEPLGEDDIQAEIEKRLEKEEFDCEEPYIEGSYEGVKYGIRWLGGAPLLWVYFSPFVGRHAQCSPCIPGAGNLDTPLDAGFECYDVPSEWRNK